MEWDSEVEDIDEVTRQLKVTIPVESFRQKYESAMSRLVETADLKGFRPGKAPRAMVEKLHGERVRSEVGSQLISSSLQDLIREHQIDLIGTPDLDLGVLELDKAIEYTARISVVPTPKIEHYDSFNIATGKSEVADSDVDQMLERLRESKASLQKLAFRTTVQSGDVIDALLAVDLEGEGEAARPEPLVIEVGEGKLPPPSWMKGLWAWRSAKPGKS